MDSQAPAPLVSPAQAQTDLAIANLMALPTVYASAPPPIVQQAVDSLVRRDMAAEFSGADLIRAEAARNAAWLGLNRLLQQAQQGEWTSLLSAANDACNLLHELGHGQHVVTRALSNALLREGVVL